MNLKLLKENIEGIDICILDLGVVIEET